MLRKFVHNAHGEGASVEEAIDSLIDMAATLYAIRLAGASTRKQQQAAKRAFMRIVRQAMDLLPSARKDAIVEAILAKMESENGGAGRPVVHRSRRKAPKTKKL